MTLIRSSTVVFIFVAALDVLNRVHGANFIFGGEAKRVCDAYKLICPSKKVCALQSIEWPRTMKFPVCVHETHVVVKSNICRKPPIPGRCKARFMRWYFNVHMGACSWFTYSGCGGNQNKFRTAEECERRCMSADKDDVDEKKLKKQARRPDEMGNSVSLFENLIDVTENDRRRGREPKLITAPAKAPEMIILDSDVTASLQLSTTAKNVTTSRREERRRRKKEREAERRRRLKNKRRRKVRKNKRTHVKEEGKLAPIQPTREFTLLKLGPSLAERHSNFNERHPENDERQSKFVEPKRTFHDGQTNIYDGQPISKSETRTPTFAEMTGRQTLVADFRKRDPDDKLIWRMDGEFRKRRRHQHRLADHTNETRDAYSGAKQEAYYDRVNLFDILKNPEVENKPSEM